MQSPRRRAGSSGEVKAEIEGDIEGEIQLRKLAAAAALADADSGDCGRDRLAGGRTSL